MFRSPGFRSRRNVLTLTLVLTFLFVAPFFVQQLTHPLKVRAATIPTPLLLIHGFYDTCGNAFESLNQGNTGNDPQDDTTVNFLRNNGWTNITEVGYYRTLPNTTNNDLNSTCTPSAFLQTQGTNHCSQLRTNAVDSSKDGTLDDPVQRIACLFAWYIYNTYTNPSNGSPTPVVILAHSMGGMITRAAIGESGQAGNSNYNSNFPSSPLMVSRVVTVGTPHAGVSGPYATLASLIFGNNQEVTDLTVGSPSTFLSTIAKIQKPQGAAPGTYWALVASSVPIGFTLSSATNTEKISYAVYTLDHSIQFPDGDGVVQAESALSMAADYKILYGAVDDITDNQFWVADNTLFNGHYNGEYSHSITTCNNFPVIGTACLNPPFYLTDARPSSQTTRAWICSSACNGNGTNSFAEVNVGTNTSQSVPFSLAKINALLGSTTITLTPTPTPLTCTNYGTLVIGPNACSGFSIAGAPYPGTVDGWYSGGGVGLKGQEIWTYGNPGSNVQHSTATYSFTGLSSTFAYQVEAYIPNNHSNASHAHYHMHSSGGGDTDHYINQNNFTNQWDTNDLGLVCSNDGNATVTLSDDGGDAYPAEVGADAIQLALTGVKCLFGSPTPTPTPPPTATPTPVGPPATGSTTACTSAHSGVAYRICVAPQVTITCGGSIGSTNDLSGIPINWTYTNGNSTCVTVDYSFNYPSGANACSFYLYAPNGHATGTIRATLSDGSVQTLNENPVAGWQYWFDATGIGSLTFTDGNGQSANQYMLGWGRNATNSIEQICGP